MIMRLVLFEVGDILSILNFIYKLFVGKHVADIMLHTPIGEISMNIDEEKIHVTPFSCNVRSHVLKDLNHK